MEHLVVRTPLIRFLGNAENNSSIFLKAENLQPFGSYKIRGVAAALGKANAQQLKHGLATASAGNMAQAVAFAAKQASLPCSIFVPDTAPAVKKNAIAALGAQVHERPFAAIWQMVRQPPTSEQLFIHPVFTPGLIDGYAGIAEEILADLPDVDAVVVPFGVGGLTVGLCRAFARLRPSVKIYPVEPETAAPLRASLQKAAATAVERKPSFIDAIGTPEVLPEVFHELSRRIDQSLVVELTETKNALYELLTRHKLLCEGAAAAALVGAQQLARTGLHQRIVAVLTGGNIDLEKFMDH